MKLLSYRDTKILRKLFKVSMIRFTLAERLIHNINILIKPYILSYIFVLVIFFGFTLLSYIQVPPSLYHRPPFRIWFPIPVVLCSFPRSYDREEDENKDFDCADEIEKLEDDGPRVAAYLRVSTIKQARKGVSLDVQRDKINSMKKQFSPSIIYWFIDAGKSGKVFENRKIIIILELMKKKLIDELWVTQIDRIGRECRNLLIFFLILCEDGVVIRTPEREHNSKDLASLLTYVIKAHTAEEVNEIRTERALASKARNFREKCWNKPVPIGYRKKERWLEKILEWEPIIKEIYSLFLKIKNITSVCRNINEKYKQFLSKPLTKYRIRRILSDPIYVGKPEHLGIVVNDPSLTYVEKKIFKTAQNILENIHRRYKTRRSEPLKELVFDYGISVFDYLEQVECHHKECGGKLVKNGVRIYKGIWQQIFLCKQCGKQFRVPSISEMKKIKNWILESSKTINPLTSDSFSSHLREKNKHSKKEKDKNKKNKNNNQTKLTDFEDFNNVQ